MPLSLDEAKVRINSILANYQIASVNPATVLAGKLISGKVYEAWVLSIVLERLRLEEWYDVTLIGSDYVRLRSSPGLINRRYMHFVLSKSASPTLEVWTDIQFLTLGRSLRSPTAPIGPGDHHELDIVIVPAGTTGRPRHDQVRLGVECKNTGFEKYMMRAALGVRRELSYLDSANRTSFSSWPRSTVPAKPPSVLMVYSTDPKVAQYDEAGQVFGIDFIHDPM